MSNTAGPVARRESTQSRNADMEMPAHRTWTVELAAWIGVGLVATALRLFELGSRPLGEAEAVQALAAHHFIRGGAVPVGTLPGPFTGNVLLFSLLGASDFTARLLPALAGIVLVLLPYWLRHRLGRAGALSAALLLAISPSAVYSSRDLGSAALVTACGLALAVGLIGFIDSHRAGFLYLAAAAGGLGLCAGEGFLGLLLILALFGLLLYLLDRLGRHQAGWSSLRAAWESVRGERTQLARAGVVLGATFLLSATTLVLHPAGIGYAADLIGAWVVGLLPAARSEPLVYPLLLLIRYEPLVVLLGLVEAGWAVLKRRQDPWWSKARLSGAGPDPGPGAASGAHRSSGAFPHSAFLAFWALAAGLLAVLSGHGPAGNILLVVVPVALLAGQGIERALRWVSRHRLWPQTVPMALAALICAAFFYLQIAAYAQASAASAIQIWGVTLYTTTSYMLLALVALLLFAGLAVVAWIWRGPELVLAAGWLAAVAALGLFGFRAMWSLNFAHSGDPRELMVMQATSQEIRRMAVELGSASLAQAGDAHTLPITVDAATGPVVAWYLREFERQALVDGISSPPDTAAVVSLAKQEPPMGEAFRGQSFPLRTHWLPWGRWGQELVRWLLFTEGSAPTVEQEVVLWVSNQQ